MDGAGDGINWSEVARPAFQSALATHEHRKGQNMQTAIERLRASKQKHAQDEGEGGKTAGRRWAANSADYVQLRKVADLDTSQWPNDEGAFRVLKDALDPEGEHGYDFGEEVLGLEPREEASDAWAFGFIEGAQEFFEEVKDDL